MKRGYPNPNQFKIKYANKTIKEFRDKRKSTDVYDTLSNTMTYV